MATEKEWGELAEKMWFDANYVTTIEIPDSFLSMNVSNADHDLLAKCVIKEYCERNNVSVGFIDISCKHIKTSMAKFGALKITVLF